jgi:beta-lactamase class A
MCRSKSFSGARSRRSDNVTADIVLRVVGGPSAVDAYLKSMGIEGFHLEDGEQRLHRDASAQYRNWFEPRGAVRLLRLLSDRSPLRRSIPGCCTTG